MEHLLLLAAGEALVLVTVCVLVARYRIRRWRRRAHRWRTSAERWRARAEARRHQVTPPWAEQPPTAVLTPLESAPTQRLYLSLQRRHR